MIYLAGQEKLIHAKITTLDKGILNALYERLSDTGHFTLLRNSPYLFHGCEKWCIKQDEYTSSKICMYFECLKTIRDAIGEDTFNDHSLISMISTVFPTLQSTQHDGASVIANPDEKTDPDFSIKVFQEFEATSFFKEQYFKRMYPDLYEYMHSILPLIDFEPEREYSISELVELKEKSFKNGLKDPTAGIMSRIENAEKNARVLKLIHALPTWVK